MLKHLQQAILETGGIQVKIDDRNRAALNQVFTYLRTPPTKGLIFTGSVGTGKSCLLECVRRCMKDLYRMGMITYTAPQIRDHYYDSPFGEQYTIKHKVHFFRNLAINDLGLEKDYKSGVNIIQEILFDRHEMGFKTWGTTNLDIKEFIERYNDDKDRILDRMKGMFDFVTLTGESFR